ncbi:MAG: hypothetical protein EBR81_04825 [Proteobacteria bacterium]|nr:hypothetical protein [Pseudomonadota bacterium]
MNEFTMRWLLTGAACAGALAVAGARLGTLTNWVLLGVWLGFWNAAPRPLLLQLRTKHILWLLLAALGGLNTLLFLTLNFWSPAMIPPAPLPLALAIISATVCSWAASSRFRAHDGRWHWITYHGHVHQNA